MDWHIYCCVGSGLCDKLITCSKHSYQVCVFVCGLETSTVRWPRPKLSCCATKSIDQCTCRKYCIVKMEGNICNNKVT
jgi:hypothetical protein